MSNPIKLILRKNRSKGSVELIGPKQESASYHFKLPWYDDLEWAAVFYSLELYEEDEATWPKDEILAKAQALGFFSSNHHPSRSRFEAIGRKLYKAVFGSEEIRKLLFSLLGEEATPILEFHIHDQGSLLQAYPWELLHDDDGFLFDAKRCFAVRHVDSSRSVSSHKLTDRLNILYVAPRPTNFSQEGYTLLPVPERLHLQTLNQQHPDHFLLEALAANTLDGLQKKLLTNQGSIHVVHLDTHGSFGWVCHCGRLNGANLQTCSACQDGREKRPAQGYVAFETSGGELAWISGAELSKTLHQRKVSLVVLSACKSGLVQGKSTSSSVAGALVKAGIPAVVAMQHGIEVNQAALFTEIFYLAIAKKKPVPEAMAEARIALKQDFYRPVLYLRAHRDNHRGEIFKPAPSVGRSSKPGRSRRAKGPSKEEAGPQAPSMSQGKAGSTPPNAEDVTGDLTGGGTARSSSSNRNREEWIKRVGFNKGIDPFLATDGGTDKELYRYFYPMSYYYDMLDVKRTVFVLGEAGAGKSSWRNVISQSVKDRCFPVTYEEFSALVIKHRETGKVTGYDFVVQLLKTALDTLVEMEEIKKRIAPLEIQNEMMLRNFLWLCVTTFEDDILKRKKLQQILQPTTNAEEILPSVPKILLDRFCERFSALFGYDSISFLVDPAHDIDPDISMAWQILDPILHLNSIIDPEDPKKQKYTFKFFLSQKFRENLLQIQWIEEVQNERVYELKWSEPELLKILRTRLEMTSNLPRGEVRRSLGELTQEDVGDLDDRVIKLARGRPRTLIAICNRLFSEHTRRWLPDNEETFLLSSQVVNQVLQDFEQKHKESHRDQQIKKGESKTLEFKSTMRYNLQTGKRDRVIEQAVAKTIAGFMNTEGGTLIIGVDDRGVALGLDKDFSLLGKRQSDDGFEQAFLNIITEYIESSSNHYNTHFEQYQDKKIYIIEVEKSNNAVFCKYNDRAEFFIRILNTTRKLEGRKMIDYINERFK